MTLVRGGNQLLSVIALSVLVWLVDQPAAGEPLPSFTFWGLLLHPNDLKHAPNNDLVHPTVLKTEGRIKNALGKYYLYYAPHKHISISMAYADKLEGPWTEYKRNPVIKGPSAPDIRWIVEPPNDGKPGGGKGKAYMWGHRKNSQTELWTSDDGIHFEYDSVSVKASDIGTRNATYSRVYAYPLKRVGSKYIMLYSGFIEDREIRCIWMAHSKDAKQWTQLTTPIVEPIKGEMNDCYGPAFLRYQGRNYITYQDHTAWRGGNLKYVEVDQDFTPVGAKGKRHVLLDPPAGPPLNDRYRGSEFYREGDTIYLISSGSKNPRLLVWGTAKVSDRVEGSNAAGRPTEQDNEANADNKPPEERRSPSADVPR